LSIAAAARTFVLDAPLKIWNRLLRWIL